MAKTKELILDTALKLFNEQGTAAVSTNHIAEAAGISPGNLYYHYGNKEEIIRALFERLFNRWDTGGEMPPGYKLTLNDVQGMVHASFETMWEYRFVYRETLSLLLADKVLHERFVAVRQRGYEGFRELFTMLDIPVDEDTINRLADLIWLISEYWLPTIESRGHIVNKERMQEGIDLMMEVLKPYTPK